MIFLMALIDMIGIASILPFIAVLSNPSIVETNIYLNNFYQFLNGIGLKSIDEFLFVLGGLVFLLLILSILFRALTTYLQIKFVQNCEYDLGRRLIKAYLYQNYTWFLNQNSSELGKNILSEVGQVSMGGLQRLIELFSKSILSILIIFLLIYVNPIVAISVGISISGIYFIFFLIIKSYLKLIGKKRFEANISRFKTANDAFNGIKEIKLRDLERYYLDLFSIPNYNYFKANINSSILSQLPRFFLEAITFGGSLILIFYLMTKTGGLNDALPILSLYIFAAYRLMPAIQGVYSSFTGILFTISSINKIFLDFRNLKLNYEKNHNEEKLIIKKSINLKNIYFYYPNSKFPALKDISLNIPVNSKVGFIGATGSGKTTIVDIILGLLEAQGGQLEIDEQIITKQNLKSWQRIIGYVPQQIHLIDDTLSSNIAFGIQPDKINQQIVEEVSKIANLHDFVKNELPKKYLTIIGEKGVRLSGGQRQRIGIARALYTNPNLLVLDEATSALDNNTEKMIMESLDKINKKMTIITIAHRLNTLKNCDIIYKFDKGMLVDKGSFEQIINK
jgi:ABC-type bacteriocin/lantibiotic exporter with double-glycine peptidase domain